MDDDAAEQQLVDEQLFRAALARDENLARTKPPKARARRTGNAKGTRKAVQPDQEAHAALEEVSGENLIPSLSSLPVSDLAQAQEEKDNIGMDTTSPENLTAAQVPPADIPSTIEVPDSQILPAATAVDISVSPPTTSNLPILTSPRRKRDPVQKRKRNGTGEVGSSTAERTMNGAQDTIAMPVQSSTKRRRVRKSYASPHIAFESRSTLSLPNSELNKIPASSTEAINSSEVPASVKKNKNGNRNTRESTDLHGIEQVISDIEGDSFNASTVKPLKRINTVKPKRKPRVQEPVPSVERNPSHKESPEGHQLREQTDIDDLLNSEGKDANKKQEKSSDDISEETSAVHGTFQKDKRPRSYETNAIVDWEAHPNRPSGEPFEIEDDVMAEPIASDAEEANGAESSGRNRTRTYFSTPSNNSSTRLYTPRSSEPRAMRGKQRRRSVPAYKTRPRIRKSNINSAETMTNADRALSNERTLNHPPDKRTSGDFTEDEEELIRRALCDFKQRKELETPEFVEIVQNPLIGSDEEGGVRVRNQQLDADTRELWQEIKDQGLLRKFESVRRHIRSKYNTFKSGGWTAEEDTQLKNLYELHPQKWKLISLTMGTRTEHDCHNRYRDYIQLGENRNISVWSKDEEAQLAAAVTTVCQRLEDHRAENGEPPLDEYTHTHISWPQVSREMGEKRSRLQCFQKWKKMQAWPFPPQIQVEIKPRREQPAAADAETPKKTPKKIKGSQSHKKRDAAESTKAKKRSRPRKTKYLSPDTSSQQEDSSLKGQSTKVSQMGVSDKLHLVLAISAKEFADLKDIDWSQLVVAANHTWTSATLQSALEGLLEEQKARVCGEMSFEDKLSEIAEFLVNTFPEELQDGHDPFDGSGENGGAVGSGIESESGIVTTREKGRKGRKRKQSSLPKPSSEKKFKSQEIIVESDEADSEAEVRGVGST